MIGSNLSLTQTTSKRKQPEITSDLVETISAYLQQTMNPSLRRATDAKMCS